MKCDSPFFVTPKARFEAVPVPCGRCPACKLRRVNGWVFRLLQEHKVASTSYFVTLTYDTQFVPLSPNGFMTLSKRDLQLFFKRLRKISPNVKIKYYAVGEYGTSNNRPHYHAIMFNVPDVASIDAAWQKGQVHVGQVSTNSIAYTMKYIDKPGKKRLHSRDDREYEFPLMSKKLGANYLTTDVINYHKADISRLFVTKEGGHRVALPRYYRDKIYTDREKLKQVELIQSIVGQTDQKLRLDYERLHYPDHYTFEDWKDNQRFGRYDKFYQSQKNRDV